MCAAMQHQHQSALRALWHDLAAGLPGGHCDDVVVGSQSGRGGLCDVSAITGLHRAAVGPMLLPGWARLAARPCRHAAQDLVSLTWALLWPTLPMQHRYRPQSTQDDGSRYLQDKNKWGTWPDFRWAGLWASTRLVWIRNTNTQPLQILLLRVSQCGNERLPALSSCCSFRSAVCCCPGSCRTIFSLGGRIL